MCGCSVCLRSDLGGFSMPPRYIAGPVLVPNDNSRLDKTAQSVKL